MRKLRPRPKIDNFLDLFRKIPANFDFSIGGMTLASALDPLVVEPHGPHWHRGSDRSMPLPSL
jgi:hypothetical protein